MGQYGGRVEMKSEIFIEHSESRRFIYSGNLTVFILTSRRSSLEPPSESPGVSREVVGDLVQRFIYFSLFALPLSSLCPDNLVLKVVSDGIAEFANSFPCKCLDDGVRHNTPQYASDSDGYSVFGLFPAPGMVVHLAYHLLGVGKDEVEGNESVHEAVVHLVQPRCGREEVEGVHELIVELLEEFVALQRQGFVVDHAAE